MLPSSGLARGIACAIGLVIFPPPCGAQETGTAVIRRISTEASGTTIAVAIYGSGTLPVPTSGVVEGPPRIYLDFPGVALKAPAITPGTANRVHRIRAAVRSTKPLVTRVVLDLVVLEPYIVERAPDRVTVILGGVGRGIAPVPALPEPPAPVPAKPAPARPPAGAVTPPPVPAPVEVPRAAPSAPPPPPPVSTVAPVSNAPAVAERPAARPPATSPTAPPVSTPKPMLPTPGGKPSGKDVERYRQQVGPALDRLRLQEPILASLDSAEEQTMDRVQLAVEEFERLRQEISSAKPPDSLKAQHDMLVQSTILALMATRLRLEAFRTSDPATLRNASSAAAGALLLLDRVCAELGCAEPGK